MKAVPCVGIVACALGAAACGHNGIRDEQVRAAVLRFVSAPSERVQIVSRPSCEKAQRNWRCLVGVRIPDNLNAPTVRGSNISLTTSCTETRCEVTGAKSSEYGPTNVQWRGVITDWIHGGLDHKHSCAAVKAATSHLPTHSSIYSTVNEDLAAYERKVC